MNGMLILVDHRAGREVNRNAMYMGSLHHSITGIEEMAGKRCMHCPGITLQERLWMCVRCV